MAVLVECVVGELELEERDGLLHPVAPKGRRVWVEVSPAGRLRLRFSRHLPFLFIPLWEGDKIVRESLKANLSYREGIYRRGYVFHFPQ